MSETRRNGSDEVGLRRRERVVADGAPCRVGFESGERQVHRPASGALLRSIVLYVGALGATVLSVAVIIFLSIREPVFGVSLLAGMFLATMVIVLGEVLKSNRLRLMVEWGRARANCGWFDVMSLYSYHAVYVGGDEFGEYQDFVSGYVWVRSRAEGKALLRRHGLKAVMLRKEKWWHAILVPRNEVLSESNRVL